LAPCIIRQPRQRVQPRPPLVKPRSIRYPAHIHQGSFAVLRVAVMLVVMDKHATTEQIEQVVAAVRRMNFTAHPMPGATRTAIGITGNLSAVDPRTLEVLPGVSELIRVTKPYKLASREMHEADTYVRLPQTVIGPGTFTLFARPCSVENEEMILRTGEFLIGHGVRLMRAGAYKPRSSPYGFQGLGP